MIRSLVTILVLSAAAFGESVTIPSFNGVLSPYMEGRTDLLQYLNGLRELENMFLETQGGVEKRPGTYYINRVAGETPQRSSDDPGNYKFTYISENRRIWGIPVGDGVMAGLDAGGVAVNVGGGVVGLPFTAHPFSIGESIWITGTTWYNGGHSVEAGTTADQIQFTDTFNSETFDGTEKIVKYYAVPVGQGHMAQDSSRNMYYAHDITYNAGAGRYYYITKIDVNGVASPDYEWLNITWNSGAARASRGIEISDDDAFLYLYILIPGPTPRGWMYKFNLVTGDQIWVDNASFPGYDIAIDADGNAYGARLNYTSRWRAADGVISNYTDSVGVYSTTVDDDMDVLITAGAIVDSANLYVVNLANSVNDKILLGSTHISTGFLATHDGFIYAMSSAMYKVSWDAGGTLAILDSVALPPDATGFYFDLYDNLVIVCQEWYTGTDEVLYFYDTDFNYLSKVVNLYPLMLRNWDAATGGAWLEGNAVFDNVLGEEGDPPDDEIIAFSSGDYPVRVLDFTYKTEESYVIECGHKYMLFYKEVD